MSYPSIKDVLDKISFGQQGGSNLFQVTNHPDLEWSPLLQFSTPYVDNIGTQDQILKGCDGDFYIFDNECIRKYSYHEPTTEELNTNGNGKIAEHIAYLHRNGDLYVCRNTHYGCFPENIGREGKGYWYASYPPTRTNVQFFGFGYKWAWIMYTDKSTEFIYVDSNGQKHTFTVTVPNSAAYSYGIFIDYENDRVYGYTDRSNIDVFQETPITTSQYYGTELLDTSLINPNKPGYARARITTACTGGGNSAIYRLDSDIFKYWQTVSAYIDSNKVLWIRFSDRNSPQKIAENVRWICSIIQGVVFYRKFDDSNIYMGCATSSFVCDDSSNNILNQSKYYQIVNAGQTATHGAYGHSFRNGSSYAKKYLKTDVVVSELHMETANTGFIHSQAYNQVLIKNKDTDELFVCYGYNGFVKLTRLNTASLTDLYRMWTYTVTSGREPINYYIQSAINVQEPREVYRVDTDTYPHPEGNVVNYVTTWGTTEETATANTFSSKSMTFDSSNYANYNTLLTQAAEAEIAACKAFLDIPDLVLPANTSQTYTKNGLSYTLAVNYAKGSAKNEVVTTSYIDGTIFGTATTETYSTQALANTGLSTLTTNKINAMKTACNNSPANTSEIYTKGGMNYTITTTYTKAAGNKTVTTKTNLDGAQWSSITANVSSSTLATDCANLQTNAATQVANLKVLLDDSPVNVEQTYTKGTGEGTSQSFAMRVQYTKSAGATTATCNVTCDGAVYSSSSLSVNAATLTSDLNSAASTGNTKLSELRNKLAGAPANTNEVYTVNGFNYNLGTAYSKAGDDTTDTSKAVLDGAFYGASNKSLTLATFDNDVRELESAAATSKAAVQAMLDTSPANASETYTVNGLNFAIGTVYSKAAGNTTANITTTLDGSNHSVSTQTVAMANLSSNLTSASNTAAADVAALKLLLDTKVPADTTNQDYTVDGFTYKCGARHEKSAGGSTVITQIVLDGNVVDSFNTTISAANTSADLDTLNNTITTRVNGLKANLIGIPADSESYTSNGTNFTLRVVYTKNPNNTISIQPYIDNDPYGDPYITIFDYQDESDYLAIGQSKLQDMRDSIDDVSTAFVNTSEIYTVHNNMSFRVGINYEKAAGSSIVNIFQMLDGAKVGTPNSVRYDVNDTSAVSIQAANDLASLKARLDGAPSNYTNNIAYGSMVFAVGSNFSKVEDNPNVTITTMLDGSTYGSSTTKTFDISNISELTTTAATKESTLKEILGTVPQDTTEIFNIRRFSFAITKSWIKNANSSAVTSMVKMDGTQYDQHRTLTFDITDIASLSTYNNNLAQSLKDKLLTLIPEDIHTTYSRNQFNFIIDAYFSKQANSNIVTIEYNIDSADLTGNSVTALNATTTNANEQTVVTNNSLESGVTTLNASISDAMTELNENLRQLTYNANEEVAARILGTNPRRSNN